MLAKELKIKTLKKQREFIQEQLSHADTRNDGDTAYRYVGHLYPEVIKHFESEGFVVTQVHSDLLSAMVKGLPVYLFTVGDVELSEEELEQALEGATYQLVRRGGFVASDTYAETPQKKKTQYFFRSGSVFGHRFTGDLYSVGGFGEHPVYRYAKPMFLGVDL